MPFELPQLGQELAGGFVTEAEERDGQIFIVVSQLPEMTDNYPVTEALFPTSFFNQDA